LEFFENWWANSEFHDTGGRSFLSLLCLPEIKAKGESFETGWVEERRETKANESDPST
jgi:hypothetical protein